MRGRAKAATVLMALGALVALSSCQQTFTFPLLGFLARDPVLDPSMSLADALILSDAVLAEGNVPYASLLLGNLLDRIEAGTLSAADEAAATAAAAELAILSSGTSAAVTDIIVLATDDPAAMTAEAHAAIRTVMLGVNLSADETVAFAFLLATPGGADTGTLFFAATAVLMGAATESGAPDLAAIALYTGLMAEARSGTGADALPEFAEALVAILEMEA
jgi:hypothetical protein